MIAVATTADGVVGLCDRLREMGVRSVDIVAPSDTRRVVLAAVDHETDVAVVVAALRAEGVMAVSKPAAGAALHRWLEDARPLTFGGRLSVCRAWSEHDRGDLPGLVELGPGGFGDGRHPTTRLMIEALLERIAGGERVLDVGCGSGILGLCALELGAAAVTAVDVDPDAVAAAQRNAHINGMGDRMEATSAPLGDIEGAFDAVVANIARAGVVELAPELVSHVSPHGWLAVGGISPAQGSQVAGFLRPLVEVGRRTSGEWATVVLARP